MLRTLAAPDAESGSDSAPVGAGSVLTRRPERAGPVTAAWAAVRGRLAHEWRSTALYGLMLDRPRATGIAARPRDPRPVDLLVGRHALAGEWILGGATFDAGPEGDPFDQPSPSRRTAVELHRFSWLPALLAQEAPGRREALRLFLSWQALFDRPTPFAWGLEVLERRVFNLACGARALADAASDAETAVLAQSLARQARYLARLDDGPARLCERLTAVAVAGTALDGPAGEALLAPALDRLPAALDAAITPDGALRTRSPEQGLELLLDLIALDDGLLQRGRVLPEPIARALDRLGAALRFFTLADGRLMRMNGGEAASADRVAAALDMDDASAPPFDHAPHVGVHRLTGASMQLAVDAGPAPDGAWSIAACAQPLSVEIVCGGDRLITNSGWSPDADGSAAALRLTAAGSTVSLGGGSAGEPLSGATARVLGPRLKGGATRVIARRQQNETGVWLELSHDGWMATLGLMHERRLFLDPALDELRGEDLFERPPEDAAKAATGTPRQIPYAARFHLAPGVRASLARDKRSVLLRGASDRGWWFRNDAPDVTIEPSFVVEAGEPRRTQQIVLTGRFDPDAGGRVRWKLTPVEPTPPPRLPLRRREAAPGSAVAPPEPGA